MTDCRFKKRNGLQGCATTKIQVENKQKLREKQTEIKLITWLKEPHKTTTKTFWIKTLKKLLHSGEHWKVYFPPNRNQNL